MYIFFLLSRIKDHKLFNSSETFFFKKNCSHVYKRLNDLLIVVNYKQRHKLKVKQFWNKFFPKNNFFHYFCYKNSSCVVSQKKPIGFWCDEQFVIKAILSFEVSFELIAEKFYYSFIAWLKFLNSYRIFSWSFCSVSTSCEP